MKTNKITRREFVEISGSFCLTALGVSALATAFGGCSKNESSNPTGPKENKFTVNLADYPELQQVGGYKTFTINSKPVILFRTATDAFKALSLICTHQGCTIDWKSARNRFECPCHDSQFDKDGNVIQGPASSSLPTYTTEYDSASNQVIIYY